MTNRLFSVHNVVTLFQNSLHCSVQNNKNLINYLFIEWTFRSKNEWSVKSHRLNIASVLNGTFTISKFLLHSLKIFVDQIERLKCELLSFALQPLCLHPTEYVFLVESLNLDKGIVWNECLRWKYVHCTWHKVSSYVALSRKAWRSQCSWCSMTLLFIIYLHIWELSLF